MSCQFHNTDSYKNYRSEIIQYKYSNEIVWSWTNDGEEWKASFKI